MKTLIVYSSKSGNTKKLAESAAAFLPGEVDLKPVEEKPEIDGYDLVLVGFWFQGGLPDPESGMYLSELKAEKLFLFATHGAAADSEHAKNGMREAEQLASASRVIGRFNCQGEVRPAVLETAAKKDPPPPWLAEGREALGHPDAADISRFRSVLEKLVDSAS